MRAVLIVIVLVECLALLAGAGLLALGGDRFVKEGPEPQVFRPPLYSAVIGDSVRYRRVDPKNPDRELGFLDFEVVGAIKTQDTGLGARFTLRMTRTDDKGRTERRHISLQPELIEDGWMPPRFDEAAWVDVPGGRPVIRTIRTRPVPPRLGRAPEPGFEIETVIPRDGLDTIAERFEIHPLVPVFGVVRWETADELLLLHRSHREPRKASDAEDADQPEGGS